MNAYRKETTIANELELEDHPGRHQPRANLRLRSPLGSTSSETPGSHQGVAPAFSQRTWHRLARGRPQGPPVHLFEGRIPKTMFRLLRSTDQRFFTERHYFSFNLPACSNH